MLSSDQPTLQLLALLKAHGITDLVLCPGSRNAGIVHSALQTDSFTCHRITDERSAGFYALGIALSTHRPAAVIVTSGSALANLYPSACEAYYQQIPVVYISADRPARWIGQMDGQTMPQHGALGKMVKLSVTLPPDDPHHANRLINEALLESHHHTPGPVHINIPIDEPIYKFDTQTLPHVRVIERTTEKLTIAPQTRTLVLIGQMDKATADRCTDILNRHDAKVIAENLSNLHPQRYINTYHIDWEHTPPFDLVITLGGHLTNKAMKERLRLTPPSQHWHVSPDGAIADTFGSLTRAIESTPEAYLPHIAPHSTTDLPLLPPHDNPTPIIDELISQLPEGSILHLANSSTIRHAQHSLLPSPDPEKNHITICCNRGINGIEGTLSTAVGYARASHPHPNYIIIGDLSFLYDQNALWNADLPDNLHILLLNDHGGGIFDTLPIPPDPRSRDYIQAHHDHDASHLAAHYHLKYLTGADKIHEFIHSTQSTILEIKKHAKQ